MTESIALTKSKSFAIRIISLYKYLAEEKKEFVLSKQILRSGTSIGANLSESRYAISKSDFIAKVYIALKETSETQYWLELLFQTQFIPQEMFDSLIRDCNEIIKILTKTTKTLKEIQ